MYAHPAQKSTHPAERRVRKRGVARWQAVSPCSAKQDASWGKQEGGRCPLLLSIVSTGFAGRAGRFFGASAQKNQFRVSKNAADENSSGALTAPPSSSIVSTGSAGRAGRFFGASAQKNQFRVSKTRAGREFVRLESPRGRFQHCFITRMKNSTARPAGSRRMCSSLPWIVCRSSAVRSIAEKR